MNLAIREGSSSSDNLPEPETLPFDPDEMEWIYELWTLWTATEKRYLPSQLIHEMLSGHGRILTGLFDMESLYARTKQDLKNRMPTTNK